MLSKEERHRIHRQAYIPEHLPDYVTAISGAKPYLIENHLCFCHRRHMMFIGFPLGDSPSDTGQAYLSACERCKPVTVSIIAPEIWLAEDDYEKQPPDSFYRLKLPLNAIQAEVAYMVRRAQRDLTISRGKFGREHKRIVKEFLKARQLTPEQIYLFEHLRHYLKLSPSAVLLDARKGSELVAFTVLDLGAADYAFYLFNFRSLKFNIPGASDLLFREMANIAQSDGKKAINLGLAINAGIRRFKEKWGGVPFLSYNAALVYRETPDLDELARKL
ncbi:MAG: hypothetical protein JSW26_01075 [Desulfobacterales bacterium]|nr:MAG: hypothetical protein JSW26_01075 [Desulfobacterales bacterium]